MYELKLVANLPKVKEASSGGATNSPDAAYEALKEIGTLAQECFVVLTLNGKNEIIGQHLITLGLVDASLVAAREVFRPAIIDGAASIILAHNHPSGHTDPSAEDLRVTKKLIEAGEIIGITVVDHLIIGKGYTSLREGGLAAFK